jgi:hypothetical protein
MTGAVSMTRLSVEITCAEAPRADTGKSDRERTTSIAPRSTPRCYRMSTRATSERGMTLT